MYVDNSANLIYMRHRRTREMSDTKMNVIQKIRVWYRGRYIPRSFQQMVDRSIPRFETEKENIPDRFRLPLLARIINPISRFWLRHWQWIIRTIIALGMLILMILEFRRKQL